MSRLPGASGAPPWVVAYSVRIAQEVERCRCQLRSKGYDDDEIQAVMDAAQAEGRTSPHTTFLQSLQMRTAEKNLKLEW